MITSQPFSKLGHLGLNGLNGLKPVSATVGLRLWTPNAIHSLIDEIETDLKATGRMVPGANLTAPETASWADFQAEVYKWIRSDPSGMWSASIDRAIDYQKRIVDWRDLLLSKGAKAIGPAPRLPANESILPSFTGGTKLALVVGAAAALAVTLAVKSRSRKSDE